jgi:hypothetical protein
MLQYILDQVKHVGESSPTMLKIQGKIQYRSRGRGSGLTRAQE